MASGVLRGARGGAVAILGLCGFLFSCSTVGSAPSGSAAAAGGSADLARTAAGDPAPAGTESAARAPAMRVTDTFDAVDLEKQFEAVARRVSPAVVAISATESKIDSDVAQRSDEVNPEKLLTVLDAVDRTVGTGFIIDPDGYVLTNEHVISKTEQVWVTLDDRRVFPAIVVGSDPRSDLAVLKIPARGLTAVRFAAGEGPHRGQWAIAIGNPYGLAGGGEMAVSVGVVSALGRSLPKLSGKEDRLYSDLIQTTAQINPGNSGGPLFDAKGDVIGVNTAVILPQKQTNGIGFAMPADRRLKEIVACLKEGREVAYGFLGVRVATPTNRECREAGAPGDGGARVDVVEPGSPAEEAKLRVGDIILKLNDESVHDGDSFVRTVGAAGAGIPVQATICRTGSIRVIPITLRRREVAAAPVTRETQRLRWRGLLIGPIPARWVGPGKRPETGVMVLAVDPKSPSAKDGVSQGSIIATVGGQTVTDVPTLQQIINDLPAEKCSLGLAETCKPATKDKAIVSAQETP